MTAWKLILRSLRFHRRTHAGVALGTAVAAAVLAGALAVGDSLRQSLRDMTLTRVGRVEAALAADDRFVQDSLAAQTEADLGCPTAAVLLMSGAIDNETHSARAGQATVLGVDERFWKLFPCAPLLSGAEEDEIVLNDALARQLGVKAGDFVFLRLPRPSMLPADVALWDGGQRGLQVRMTVKAMAGAEQFGRFGLVAAGEARNAFVPLRWLQKRLKIEGLANLVLAGGPAPSDAAGRANRFLGAYPDRVGLFGLDVRWVERGGLFELRSRRVFIDPPIEKALQGWGVLTYFVNEIRDGNFTTPYSMVCGMPLGAGAALEQDQICLADWEANDIRARPGDKVNLTYYVLTDSGRLEEKTSLLEVAPESPIPLADLDPELMPDFPGVAEANECREWQPGIPIDTRRIRPKDEQYWRQHRGTPKAVVSLATAQRLWGNRYGRLTAIRLPTGSADPNAAVNRQLEKVSPAELGLLFRPVRAEALAAAERSMDFGWLFAGMSMFLIASALLLTGMLFGLSIRQRAGQLGMMLASGFTPRRARRILLGEGLVVALVGSAIGAAVAVGFGLAVLRGLRTLLPATMDVASLRFHVSAAALGQGAGLTLLMAAFVMWISLRRLMRRSARELLAAGGPAAGLKISSGRGFHWSGSLALVFAAGAIALILSVRSRSGPAAAGAFFGAGASLLGAFLAVTYALLGRRVATPRRPASSLAALGVSAASRRVGRSLAVTAMLACGTFIVVAVGANWRGPLADPYDRASGTGGFALIAQTAVPIPADPFAIREPGPQSPPPPPPGVSVVPIRVHKGDETSCLNLGRPQQPTVWGVPPQPLGYGRRRAFTAQESPPRWVTTQPVALPYWWDLLNEDLPDHAVPAFADATTLEWALGKAVGDTITITDGQGRPVNLRIVASVAPSILQGGLIVSEEQFQRLYPSSGGYRMFLIDAPPEQVAAARERLASSRVLQDAGIDVMTTTERLAEFSAVENAYLSMFQVLGGLGVVLGTAGLGFLVARNVLERRGELALLRAVGFSRGRVRRLVLWEHWLLLAAGLVSGCAAGGMAVLPALRGGASFPWLPLVVTVAAIAVNAVLWTWLAAAVALRGPMTAALREE